MRSKLFEPVGIKPKFVAPAQEIPRADWRDKYKDEPNNSSYKLENSSDDSELNRAIQLKSFDNTKIIEGKPGRLYYDKVNKKVKIFIDEATGWADLDYTTTP